ncbi:MAG: response regulator transcription factor [Acidobacteriaceae bacterium]
MRVLVVEDDPALAVFLQKGLMLEGHEVERVGDGQSALEAAAQQAPDLVVLDLGLPQCDGTEVLGQLRSDLPGSLVLVLTGRSDVQERVRCLDLGAEDFVLKPFSFYELMARCRALLRRRNRFADPMLRFGGVALNRMERSVSYEGVRVELTVKEFALLEFLMLRRGACCSRAELLNEVWRSTTEAGTNVVDVYITYLRKKLAAAHPDEDRWASPIETVRGLGYRLRDKRRVPRLEAPAALQAVAKNPSQAASEFACQA